MKTNTSISSLAIIILIFFFLSCTNNSQIENKIELIEFLKTENDSLRRITAQLDIEDTISSKRNIIDNYWYSDDQDGKSLRAIGISDPENHIKQALYKSPQLIPLKAVLGGEMHFNEILLLGNEWLIADYEDGHIQGKAIFRYLINDDNEVVFELIDSSNQQ